VRVGKTVLMRRGNFVCGFSQYMARWRDNAPLLGRFARLLPNARRERAA
jgi:hypothetical protein